MSPSLPQQLNDAAIFEIDALKFDYSTFDDGSAIITLGIFHCFVSVISFPTLCAAGTVETTSEEELAPPDGFIKLIMKAEICNSIGLWHLSAHNRMPQTIAGISDIIDLVRNLSDKHLLKNRPPQYIADFASAAFATYANRKLEDRLQQKFFIPNDAQFTEEAYLQVAAELTVASYVRSRNVSDFDIDKRLNPPNQKDVDVSYQLGSTRVAIEVKCPYEEPQDQSLKKLCLLPAGHIANYQQTLQKFKAALGSMSSIPVEPGKNRELRLKDAITSAHLKFPAHPEPNELNVLFLACGDFFRMSEWHGNLFAEGGLFTDRPFHPHSIFKNVDCVILSNVRYRHQVAFDYPAWSLDDALLIPIVNPHGRKNIFDDTIAEGLSVFNHYRREFLSDRIIRPEHPDVQVVADKMTKVTWFVVRQLSEKEQKRYFPVWPTTQKLEE